MNNLRACVKLRYIFVYSVGSYSSIESDNDTRQFTENSGNNNYSVGADKISPE